MRRLQDWEPRLWAWTRARLGQPLVYGFTDCIMLALEAVDVQCGVDLAGTWRGLYGSEASGVALMLRLRTHLARELTQEGLKRLDAPFHRLGDIIIAEDISRTGRLQRRMLDRLGIGFMRAHVCLGDKSLSADSASGTVALMRTRHILAAPGHRLHLYRASA